MKNNVQEIKPRAMRDSLLEAIHTEMGLSDEIFFVSADFGSPVLDSIRGDFPERFTNVGIAEQNLINVSAGLALEGYKVFAYAIAPFITMRCFEQIRVNLALMSEVRDINVNLIGVGAGYSYVVSGPTHQCYEDLSLMRTLPNMTVLSPSDHETSADLLPYCLENLGPKYIRLDAQVLPILDSSDHNDNGFRVTQQGHDALLISTGYCSHTALKVAEELNSQGISLKVIDIFNITNPNLKELKTLLEDFDSIISLEEGFQGKAGLDSSVGQLIRYETGQHFLGIGVSNGYNFELGTRSELHENAGIGVKNVTAKIINFLKRTKNEKIPTY